MKSFVMCALMVLGGSSIVAADASGRWLLKLDPDYRGNPGSWVECTFKQQGVQLIVRCGTGSELKGEVRGRTLTWGIEKSGIPPNLKDRLVLTHIASLSASGDTFKGTWRLRSSVLDTKGTIEAKRKR